MREKALPLLEEEIPPLYCTPLGKSSLCGLSHWSRFGSSCRLWSMCTWYRDVRSKVKGCIKKSNLKTTRGEGTLLGNTRKNQLDQLVRTCFKKSLGEPKTLKTFHSHPAQTMPVLNSCLSVQVLHFVSLFTLDYRNFSKSTISLNFWKGGFYIYFIYFNESCIYIYWFYKDVDLIKFDNISGFSLV